MSAASQPSAAPSERTGDGARKRGPLGWLRRQKAHVEALADSPHATSWLFAIAVMEASFFPIPPDVLLIPLAVAAPRRALRFALVCTVGSVLGAIGGWAIGYLLYDTIGRAIIEFYRVGDQAAYVLSHYRENAVFTIIVAGFTPIPYKVFTILAGMNATVSLPLLLAASFIGRGARFFLVGGLVAAVGPKVKPWIDRYFDWLVIGFVVLLIGGILVAKFLFS